jgi:hypothetical protein
MDLTNKNLSFILLSSDKIESMLSILYAKDYQILPIKGFYRGQYENSALAFSDVDNDELRKELIFLLNHFDQECGIIKYKGESNAKKLFSDGSEKPMGIVLYNTDSDNISYLHNGVSFSFVEQVRYWKPNKLEDFKVGMIVEYLNNNKWFEKKIENPVDEWNRMFKLLSKYDKLRVALK